MQSPVTIDGSAGEGGGQIVRTALALACATHQSVRVVNVRAGRKSPGLKAQHVAAARLLAEITEGEVHGADVGSPTVELRPGLALGGEYEYRLQTAGSITLILQAVLPLCAASGQPFTFRLHGGTDVPFAPTWDYFQHVHLPTLERIGVRVDTELIRRGFFPQGGGEVVVRVDGAALQQVALAGGARSPSIVGRAVSHGLPKHVIDRAAEAARDALHQVGCSASIELEHHRGPGHGMSLTVRAEGGGAIAPVGACEVGQRGRKSEDVGLAAGAALVAELNAQAGVDAHQADQVLAFVALAGGGDFTVRKLTRHARTVMGILPKLLPVKVESEPVDGLTRVRVSKA